MDIYPSIAVIGPAIVVAVDWWLTARVKIWTNSFALKRGDRIQHQNGKTYRVLRVDRETGTVILGDRLLRSHRTSASTIEPILHWTPLTNGPLKSGSKHAHDLELPE